MIRIGVDGHVLTGKFQGTRTTLSSMLRKVAPLLGERELVVYSDDPKEAAGLLARPQFAYRDLGGAGSIKRLFALFPKLFRRDRIDVGVFQYIAPFSGRHIVFIHDILPLTHPHLFPFKVRLRTRLFYTLSIRRAALVAVVSDYTRQQVQQKFGVPAARLQTVLNGPSFEREVYFAEKTPPDERYIMTVGRIEPRKNTALLAEAFRKSGVEGVKLKIVGSFDPEFERGKVEGDNVEILTGLDDDALVALYRGAALFVYPSEAEGFGLPLLDAVLFGLPVISSNRTSLPEVGGSLATYFDPTAPDAADILALLIQAHFGEEPIVRPTLEQRQAHAEQFDWSRSARQFLDAVDAVVAGTAER